MQFKQTTILGLFDSSQKHFVIPVYQRAYSWEETQWTVFLKDLLEQISSSNNYFYGNILLETIKKDIEYDVIDGQQRLTTLVIFIRSLIDVLEENYTSDENIEIDFNSKKQIYLKNGGNIKLRTVEYDRPCFESLIIDGSDKFEIATPSQKRIKEGKKFFYNALSKLQTDVLLKIFDKLEETELTCIELTGKKDSALMFELQNNRGKDLTNMEKLKSYFMYQMYVHSSEEETETNIESIANIFNQIYLIINDLKSLNEDSVLIYHCNAFIKGYNYRKLEDIKEVFSKSKNKVNWIKDFVNELYTSFSNIKKMEHSKLPFLEDIRKLSFPAFVYPFIIKGYKFLNKEDLNTLYHILEIVVFRYRLINSRADIESRLNGILSGFNGNLIKLLNDIKNKFNDSNTYCYWSDDRVKEYLNGYMYKNAVLHYLLWKYEDSIQTKGYSIGDGAIDNEQIEHISPQTPTNEEPLATGYEVDENNEYSDEFKENKLNCLGNLMLISGSHNSSIGNKPFSEKVETYNANPLLKQQAEIKTFVATENKWGICEIEKRQKKIIDFALKKWDFDNIEIGK